MYISDERAIDAFTNGLRRRDLVEELGRANPKTVTELMDIANKWANGEDAVQTKWPRSPEEERHRNNNPHRRCCRSFNEYDGPSQVSVGFRSDNNSRDDYRIGGGYGSDNRDAPGTSKPNNRPRPPRDFNMTPEQLLNGPY